MTKKVNPEDYRCGWCLQKGHMTAQCPGTKDWLVRPPEVRAPTDEVNEKLAERMMLYRAMKNGLLGYARERGWIFPAPLLLLDPDYPTDG